MDNSSNDHSGTHTPSGRWRLGLLLSLLTVLLWSTVPVALSLLLGSMDAVTITWYRFLVATVVLSLFLRSRGTLPRPGRLMSRKLIGLLAVAAIGLIGSFVLYLSSLRFIPPGASAVVYQLATFFMLFGGVVLFKESFQREQWLGLAALTLGLGLFFNDAYARGDYGARVPKMHSAPDVEALVGAFNAMATKVEGHTAGRGR